MAEALVRWEHFDRPEDARSAVGYAMTTKAWDYLGDIRPADDRVMAVEKDDGIHLYYHEDPWERD